MSDKNTANRFFSINTLFGVCLGISISLIVLVVATYYMNNAPRIKPSATNLEKEAPLTPFLSNDALNEEPNAVPLWRESATNEIENKEEIIVSTAITKAMERNASEPKIQTVPGEPTGSVTEEYKFEEQLLNKDASKKEEYYVQTGVFNALSEADNLKGELALLGVIANITDTKSANADKKYRVRIGPFKSETEAKKIADQVRTEGITPYLIRP